MTLPSRATALVMLLGIAGQAALAQGAPAPAPRASAPAYQSAFEGYRGYKDQAVGSWKEANDLVRRIGGWQTYAREAAAAPAGEPAPARPASGVPSGGHSGHKHP